MSLLHDNFDDTYFRVNDVKPTHYFCTSKIGKKFYLGAICMAIALGVLGD